MTAKPFCASASISVLPFFTAGCRLFLNMRMWSMLKVAVSPSFLMAEITFRPCEGVESNGFRALTLVDLPVRGGVG